VALTRAFDITLVLIVPLRQFLGSRKDVLTTPLAITLILTLTRKLTLNPGDAREPPAAEVLVSTDICLRTLEGRSRSMALPLLINYDLPVRRVRDWG